MALAECDKTADNFQNVHQICRLCLSEEFLEDIHKDENLQQWICDFLSITVSTEDGLTQSVCDICRIRLSEFHQFRLRCQEVQTILQSTGEDQNDNVDEPTLMENGSQGFIEHMCTYCGKAFEVSSHLTKHMEMHENSDRGNSDKLVPTEDELQEVINQLYERTDFTITKQSQIVEQQAAMGSSHENGQENEKHFGYEQTICIDESDDYSEASVASRRNEPSTIYQTEDFDSRTNEPHEFLTDGAQTITIDEIEYNQSTRCNICNKEFQCKRKLRGHIVVVHGPKKQQCYVCKVKFALRSSLLRHLTSKQHLSKVQEIHPTEALPEEICTTDDVDNDFVCTKCDRTFGRACYLTSHMKIHFGKNANKFTMATNDGKVVPEEQQQADVQQPVPVIYVDDDL